MSKLQVLRIFFISLTHSHPVSTDFAWTSLKIKKPTNFTDCGLLGLIPYCGTLPHASKPAVPSVRLLPIVTVFGQ